MKSNHLPGQLLPLRNISSVSKSQLTGFHGQMLNLWRMITDRIQSGHLKYFVAAVTLQMTVILTLIVGHIYDDTRVSAIVFRKLLLIGTILFLFWSQSSKSAINDWLLDYKLLLLAMFLFSNEIVSNFYTSA